MATLIQSAYVEAAYEDMFKEITRKLYGEETGNGLHTLGTPVAQVATSGPTAPEGERSFTNLVRLPIDRSVVAPTIEYEHNNGGAGGNGNGGGGTGQADTSAATTSAGNFKPEDQLSTAFGLAALMQQNGFTSGGTILGTQTIQKTVNPSTSNSNVVGNAGGEARWTGAIPVTVSSGAEEIVQWPTSGKLGSYNGTLKAAKSAKVRDPPNEIYTSPTSVVTNNNNTTPNSNTPSVVQHSQQQQQHVVTTPTTSSSNSRKKNAAAAAAAAAANQQNAQLQIPKRYACTHCPYSTDRRDLYTRHENIHKDEKPFQCYACLKQFNRADHVKKHFLRMHREMVYDINKTRRNVPSTVSTQQQQHNQQQSHQIDQKPNIFLQQQVGGQTGVVHAENFMTGQRQETSSSLSIAQTIESVATATHTEIMPVMKQEKNTGDDTSGTGGVKVKREKRFTCCYCPWSGADKWGLKRHLNTHTKPFVCMLCDYKAARSERLATHVLKVHNKKACNKCSFLADNQEEYLTHMNDVHPLNPRSGRTHNDHVIRTNLNNNTNNNNNNNNSNLNVLRTIGNTLVSNNNQTNNFQNPSTSFGAQSTANSSNNSGVNSYATTDLNGSNNAMNNGNAGPLQEIMVNPTSMVGWRLSANGSLIPPHDLITGGLAVNANQKRGAERLFQYLEADGSDPEDYARLLKMDAMSRNTASVAQDFHKAGGVDLKNQHQFFNNNTTTSKHAAASLLQNNKHNQNNHQHKQKQQRNKQTNHNLRRKGFSSCGSTSDETEEDYENMENIENFNSSSDQRKAMSAFLSRNFGLQEKIHPIPLINNNVNIKMEKVEMIKIKEEPTITNQSTSSPTTTTPPPPSTTPTRKQQQSVDSIKQQPMKSPPAQPINLTNNKKKNNNNNNQSNINQLKANVKQNNNNTTNHSRRTSSSTTKSPVISNNNNNNNSTLKGHRLDLIRDKENSNSIFSTMEYQNLSKFGTQFQNYVKDIIFKYYAETPLLFPIVSHQHHNVQQQQQQQLSPPPAKRQKLSETEEYIEYLKNKEDITLTITPKINHNNNSSKTPNINNNNTKNQFNSINNNSKNITNQTRPAVIVKQSRTPPRIKEEEPKVQVIPVINYAHGNLQSLVNGNTFYPLPSSLKPSNVVHQYSDDDNSAPIDMSSNSAIYDSRRSNRKQAQPKKIKTSPEVVMAQLRDKYLKKMVDRKKSCVICTNNNQKSMLVFPYHTPASLRLHRLWKHSARSQNCGHCNARFTKMYSLKVHCRLVHRK